MGGHQHEEVHTEDQTEMRESPAARSTPPIDECYHLPQRGEWPFAFTRIDAVYLWTQGGYQVSRNPADYPIFLAVREQDCPRWEDFFEDIGVPMAHERQPSDAISGPVQIVLETRPQLDRQYVNGYPVIPLNETLAYMRTEYAHFQPAFAMLDRMYPGVDIEA